MCSISDVLSNDSALSEPASSFPSGGPVYLLYKIIESVNREVINIRLNVQGRSNFGILADLKKEAY